MKHRAPSHRDTGLLAILSKAWAYDAFRHLVARRRTRIDLVEKLIRPFPGCRILEIGCGTASVLSDLPASIGAYTGFDMNPSYIAFARQRWKDRDNCHFVCKTVEDAQVGAMGSYDIVLAFGILHHLSDPDATRLFKMASDALTPEGVLITWDGVYVPGQRRLARWFISRDRGRAVRTVSGYTQLGAPYFSELRSTVLHDALRIPYTILTMRCTKTSAAPTRSAVSLASPPP